jgi:hypothetical protein
MHRMVWSLPVRALRSAKFAVAILWLFSEAVYAADMQTILANLSRIILPLTAMTLMISFAAGVYMIFHALTLFKKFGNMSMQAQPGELSGPLMQIFVGTVLIYLPTSSDVLMNSIFGTTQSLFGFNSINYQNLGVGSSLLGYASGGGFAQQWAALANTLVFYIQFLGLLSFVKGWFILSKSVGQGAQPDMKAKGITHIIGGIIAMNFVGAINVIMNTVYGS